jgi:hypothetical protein
MAMAETSNGTFVSAGGITPAEIENIGYAGIDGMRGRQRAVSSDQRHRNDGGFGRLLVVVPHVIFSIETASPHLVVAGMEKVHSLRLKPEKPSLRPR